MRITLAMVALLLAGCGQQVAEGERFEVGPSDEEKMAYLDGMNAALDCEGDGSHSKEWRDCVLAAALSYSGIGKDYNQENK